NRSALTAVIRPGKHDRFLKWDFDGVKALQIFDCDLGDHTWSSTVMLVSQPNTSTTSTQAVYLPALGYLSKPTCYVRRAKVNEMRASTPPPQTHSTAAAPARVPPRQSAAWGVWRGP